MKYNKYIICSILLPLIILYVYEQNKFYIYNSNYFSKLFLLIFPLSSRENICFKLQNDLLKDLNTDFNNISITIINRFGDTIVDINGNIPRIPASNQKLISTAYALDRLGPDFRFNTFLSFSKDNTYHLHGNGDPDFSKGHVKEIIRAIKENELSNNSVKSSIKFNIYEESREYWWPNSWSYADRKMIYGAPITRNAYESNSSTYSLINPSEALHLVFKQRFIHSGINSNIQILNTFNNNTLNNSNTILKIKSAPLYSYLTLANSQSHNFTSEIVLRNSFNNWDINKISPKVINWMNFKRINTKGIKIYDASGLSRKNKLTTNTLASLLSKMNNHRYSEYYTSSFSLYGIRGTLRDMKYHSRLTGNFLGKTGTLNDVSSLSGVLDIKDNPLFISIISNKYSQDSLFFYNILRKISNTDICK